MFKGSWGSKLAQKADEHDEDGMDGTGDEDGMDDNGADAEQDEQHLDGDNHAGADEGEQIWFEPILNHKTPHRIH